MLNSKASETLVLHVFSLRRARARYILRIKPNDVLSNPGVTHHSSQWVRNVVGTERVTPGLTRMTPCHTADLNECKR